MDRANDPAGPSGASLDEVLITDELRLRPSRPPDYAAENQALGVLAKAMAAAPQTLLQILVDSALRLCRADSAGISILEPQDDAEVFHWRAITDRPAPLLGDSIARLASPCEVVLDRNSPLLFKNPERRFPELIGIALPVSEGLLVPFHLNGEPIGTVWAVAHGAGQRFDAEDARVLTSLSQFASAAYQMEHRVLTSAKELRVSEERLRLALSAARMGIWIWDIAEDSHTRDANLNRLLGLPAVETKQSFQEFLNCVHPDDRNFVAEAFRESVRQGRDLNIEFRVVWPNGTIRWLRDQGDLCGHPEDKSFRMTGACADITDLKDAQEGLRKSRDELELRVRERTTELSRALRLLEDEEQVRKELVKRIVTAQEDERRRIARELHDQMGQFVTGLILNLKLAKSAVSQGADSSVLLAELDRVEKASALISQEAHRMAVELRPTALDDFGLAAALNNYLEEWSKRYNIETDLQCSSIEAERLPREIETALYRIVLEALVNVVKHADAQKVTVVVSRFKDRISLVIEDNGKGFDPDAAGQAQGRLGLLGMRERAMLLGGSLEIESAPGGGTAIFVRIPNPKPEPDASES